MVPSELRDGITTQMSTPTPRRFLVITADGTDLGQLAGVFDRFGCPFDIAMRDGPEAVRFDPRVHVGLVVLGDDRSHSDDDSVYGRDQVNVTTALAAGCGVLGICHGAQLLAHTLGANLHRGKSKADSGLVPVTLTEYGVDDPVLRAVRAFNTAQWHFDTFDLPDEAVPLAYSHNRTRTHVDAFRYGDVVYGLGFHPEVTADALVRDGWCDPIPPAIALKRTAAAGTRVLAAWVVEVLVRSPDTRQPTNSPPV